MPYSASRSSLLHGPIFFPGDPASDLTLALGDLEGVAGEVGAGFFLVFLGDLIGFGVGDRLDSLSDKSSSRLGAILLGAMGLEVRGRRGDYIDAVV